MEYCVIAWDGYVWLTVDETGASEGLACSDLNSDKKSTPGEIKMFASVPSVQRFYHCKNK